MMSRGSPRRSFSPIRSMSQSYSDRRHSSNYVPHQFDRPYTSSEVNRSAEFQPLKYTWDEMDRAVPPRLHSPVNHDRARLPGMHDTSYDDKRSYGSLPSFRDATLPPYRERQLTPGAITTFRDKAVTPGIAPSFRDRAVTPATMAPGGRVSFQDSQVAPYISDERPLGNDHRTPGGPQMAASVTWDPRSPRSDQRSRPSRPITSSPYAVNRSYANSGQRSLLEPSAAWKRAQGERDRHSSIEYRTIIPADYRSLPSDYGVDGTWDSTPGATSMTQYSDDVQDFQARRFRQQVVPKPSSSQFDQRPRYPQRLQAPDHSRRPQIDNSRRGPNFSTPRRPLHRISARISARPKRSPSPTSVSSDSSASGPSRSRRRSRSRSPSARSHMSSLDRESRRDFTHGFRSSPPRRRSPEYGTRQVVSSPARSALGRFNGFLSRPQSMSPSAPLPPRPPPSPTSANLPLHPSEAVEITQQVEKVLSPRSPSPSSQSSQNSIRSSVHSPPDVATTNFFADPNVVLTPSIISPPAALSTPTSVSVVPPPPPWRPPPDDLEFELPGMRFIQKDGALKPGILPPSPNLVAHIQENLTKPPSHTHDQYLGTTDYGSETEVDGQAQDMTTDALKFAVNRDADSFTIDRLPSSMPSPPTVPDISFVSETAVDRTPPSVRLSPSQSVVDDLKKSEDLPVSTVSASEEEIVNQKMDEICLLQRVESLQTKANEIVDSGSVAPESSPLSEPMPLSPPPDLPGLRVDAHEDGSSMDVGDESASEVADDIAAALRIFAKAREGKDLQTRNERYEPILRANHSLLDASCARLITSSDEVVREVMEGSFQARLETHSVIAQSLLERFSKQSEEMAAKERRLRAEYKSYHDRWVANCRKLDQSMASSASQGLEGLPPPSGRITRRSSNFGDAVRSDLEMEQIIASLGNEDLTDPNVLAIRNTAVIPDLICTDPFMAKISFKDDNGLVDNPEGMFDLYEALGRWTDEEKDIYLQKYGIYPKQFDVIASFLPGKTSAQCVMFYYLHKKDLIDFRAAIAKYGPKRKRKGGRKSGKGKGNALMADIVKPSRSQTHEGTTHKHSDRFRAIPDLDDHLIPNRRRVRLLQERDTVISRPFSDPTGARRSRLVTRPREEDTPGSDVDSSRPNRRRQSPRLASSGARLSASEDGDETGTVVVMTPDDRRKKHSRPNGPQDTTREQGVTQDPLKIPKLLNKGKEKEKRPPGRPPKKSRDRGKSGDKHQAKNSSNHKDR